jgi:hypothetical protein
VVIRAVALIISRREKLYIEKGVLNIRNPFFTICHFE